MNNDIIKMVDAHLNSMELTLSISNKKDLDPN